MTPTFTDMLVTYWIIGVMIIVGLYAYLTLETRGESCREEENTET